MIAAGDVLSLAIEKPVAGGRMLARHEGQVLLVAGAIPGERVRARVTAVRGGVGYADTEIVEAASGDRRDVSCDPRCGGLAYAHVSYARQPLLKAEIIADAFARLGRLPLEHAVVVRPSPEEGYRMRARLHVRGGRIGFFREGTHELCDAERTRQLLPETGELIGSLEERMRRAAVREVGEIELSENVPASERALLVDVAPDTGRAAAERALGLFADDRVTGVGIMRGQQPLASRGSPYVHDVVRVESDGGSASVRFRRHAAAFFQGNRHLLAPLASAVVGRLPRGPLVELYAGSGLFGVSFAALGRGRVTAVEGDRAAADDLGDNASPFGDAMQVVTASVESWIRGGLPAGGATVLVDPPRTGMSKDVTSAIAASSAPRVVYVSCDVATLARDARRLIDAGYRLGAVEGFDLFPNTAHVESVVVFESERG